MDSDKIHKPQKESLFSTIWRGTKRIGSQLKGKSFLFPLILLIVVVGVTYLLQPLMFQKVRQLNSNIRTMIPLMFLAVGQALVIINGSIDLSIGPLMSMVAAVMVTNLQKDSPVSQYALIVGLGMLVGILAGGFNGFLVSRVRLPAFITTYATGYVFNGIALTLLPRPGGNIPDEVAVAYRGAIPLDIPIGVWLAGDNPGNLGHGQAHPIPYKFVCHWR
jgi:ribose/xylose/arabinose/galactoside ABC-type transport system permease subunit